MKSNKYMLSATCGCCGVEMLQAAAGTTVYHVCPYCGNCFSMVVSSRDSLMRIPGIMTEEDIRVYSMAEEDLIK